MGRHAEPKCKQCRREGEKLFLKGKKCFTEKCPVKRRPYGPGQHGQSRKTKNSDYKVRLREKQKARRIYGISEKQFENYFNAAMKAKGVTGELLLEYLERRLDNVIYRLGLTASRNEARQFVRHGHFIVNDKQVDVPSFRVKANDVIKVVPSSSECVKKNMEKAAEKKLPAWLSLDEGKMEAKVESIPKREDVELAIDELLIVEYYSR